MYISNKQNIILVKHHVMNNIDNILCLFNGLPTYLLYFLHGMNSTHFADGKYCTTNLLFAPSKQNMRMVLSLLLLCSGNHNW